MSPWDLHPCADDADDAGGEPCPDHDGQAWVALLAAIRAGKIDPDRLLPAATVYVHLSAHTLHHATRDTHDCPYCTTATADGNGDAGVPVVARGEDEIGPLLLDQVRDLLAHRRVDLKPVIDLNDTRAVDCYEVPAWMAEAQRLRNPAEAAPYSPNLSRTKQHDHTIPFARTPDGKPALPGQTRPDNLGLLGTRMHRVKTHARGWRLYQPQPGVYLWRTRHGYWYRVDHQGTHPLGKHPDLRPYGIDDDRPDHGSATA